MPMQQTKKSLSLDSIHSRTVTLEKAAGDLGDAFLQYLYRLARLHIEERAGVSRGKNRHPPFSKDHDISEPDD